MDELNDNDPMALIIPMGVYRRLSEFATRHKITPSEVVERFVDAAEAVQEATGVELMFVFGK